MIFTQAVFLQEIIMSSINTAIKKLLSWYLNLNASLFRKS